MMLAGTAPPRLPTLDDCESLMRRAGLQYKGEWQRDILRHICEHRYTTLRGPRQNSGKTWSTCVYTATAIELGNKVGIGMPTQRQGQHIISMNIGRFLEPIERSSALKRLNNNIGFRQWSNGAYYVILSTDEEAAGGVQGYPCDILIVDEAHEASQMTWEMLEPTIYVAQAEERDKVHMIGVGGDGPNNLLTVSENLKSEAGAKVYEKHHITPELIINGCYPEHRERYQKFFDNKKATLSPRAYGRNIMCEDWEEGKRRIFPELRALPDGDPDNGRIEYYHGIDVGKKDSTVIATFRCNVTGFGLQRRLLRAEWVHSEIYDDGFSYVKQAKDIISYICDPRWGGALKRPRYNFAIETNAVGDALRDIILETMDDALISWTNARFKQDAVDTFNRGFAHGWLGVSDDTTATHLASLNFEMKVLPAGGSKTDYDHSDILSAGLVGIMLLPPVGFAGMQRAA